MTQPRRIAAVSVARRVCEERGWRLGDTCGYQIGLDHEHVSVDKTRICYVTTGVLLQKLINNNCLGVYTHIIVDEVHERTLDTDFVLLICKLHSYARTQAATKLKVVLMSATFDTSMFREYFAEPLETSMLVMSNSSAVNSYAASELVSQMPAPLVHVDSSTYRVHDVYWDQLVEFRTSCIKDYMEELFLKRYQSLYASYGFVDMDQLLNRTRLGAIREHNQFVYSSQHRDRVRSDKRAAYELMTSHMRQVKFDSHEPDMKGEAMLMVICLLRYFDDLDIKAVKESPDYYKDEDDDNDSSHVVTEDDEDKHSNLDAESQLKKKQSRSGEFEQRRRVRIINGMAEKRSSVLIFVPGMEFIKELQELLQRELPDNKLRILPLHSDIVLDQQKLVFEPSQPLMRKVIISTTIAESSITVPDVKVNISWEYFNHIL